MSGAHNHNWQHDCRPGQVVCPVLTPGCSCPGVFKNCMHVQDLLNLDNNAVEDAEAGIAALMSSLPSVSFSKLFERIVGSLQQPQSALLLYTLLTRCRLFRCSVLVRSDIDTLIVPLLEQLYSGSSAPVKHLYILLVRSFQHNREQASVLSPVLLFPSVVASPFRRAGVKAFQRCTMCKAQ